MEDYFIRDQKPQSEILKLKCIISLDILPVPQLNDRHLSSGGRLIRRGVKILNILFNITSSLSLSPPATIPSDTRSTCSRHKCSQLKFSKFLAPRLLFPNLWNDLTEGREGGIQKSFPSLSSSGQHSQNPPPPPSVSTFERLKGGPSSEGGEMTEN